ncbi:hypothetical protein [Pseudonocardia oroxyli]|uniref:Uncharacterized protein n=1 Tax=Pseudonocardia oroxyli TaxID=366584 RepID=A0A1G7S2Z3_PSEOR|nr:hypothetical protein [Pseudonocardia oroxyli]SDG17352.1 hypothetical protein SAMN05216377_109218 [Pseudonocardia oroxyli]
MTTQHYRSADVDPATEAIPVIPVLPVVPAQRSPRGRTTTVGEAAGMTTWQRAGASRAESAPLFTAGPAPASFAESAAQAEPWASTLSRREEKQARRQKQTRKGEQGRRRWPWLTAGLAVGLLFGVMIGQGMGGTAAPTAAPAPQTETVAAPPAQPAGPATTVSDGTYEVGVDMAAGRYKTEGPSASNALGMCYWERASTDSGELGSIIANEIVQGPGSVTVQNGEFATLRGGCTWTRV